MAAACQLMGHILVGCWLAESEQPHEQSRPACNHQQAPFTDPHPHNTTASWGCCTSQSHFRPATPHPLHNTLSDASGGTRRGPPVARGQAFPAVQAEPRGLLSRVGGGVRTPEGWSPRVGGAQGGEAAPP